MPATKQAAPGARRAPRQGEPVDPVVKRSALIMASTGAFMLTFMVSAINIAMPMIQDDLGADAIMLSWVAMAYLLAAAVALVPFGKLADIYGRKKVYLSGVVTFTIASLIASISTTTLMLIVCRIFQGIGSAMMFATGLAILTSVYPPQERGGVLGWTVAAVYAGLSCGPFFGGLLIQYFSWRSVLLINVPPSLFLIYLLLRRLRGEWAEAAGEKFDALGALLYGGAITLMMLGFSDIPSLRGAVLIAVSVAGLVAFVLWEQRTRYPVFNVHLFTMNRVFAFSCLAALIHYCATFGVTFLLSLFLQYNKGLTPRSAGIVLITQPIVMALCSPLAGRLSDRIEPRVIASAGMALTGAGLVLLRFIHGGTPLAYIVASLVVVGIGFALFSSPNMNAIMGSVERRYYGIASGSVGTMRLLGQMLSMGIVTLTFAVVMGKVEITPEHYAALIASMKIILTVNAGLCALGVFFSVSRGAVR